MNDRQLPPSKITVLMPCYNGMKYIRQAIDSVLAQSFAEWELLVSDDGSNDGTRDYLQSLTDKRIKVFLQPKNLGIFGNLNFLFARASSPLTQILCQDDNFIGPDALSTILKVWAGLPASTAFLRCNFGCDAKKGGLMTAEQQVLPTYVQPAESDFYFLIFGCLPGNLSNVSIRTELVAKMGWFRTDLPYAGDFEFWSRVGRELPWALNRSHVVMVRFHADSASSNLNKRGELLPQMWQIVQGLFESLRKQGYSSLTLRIFVTANYVVRHMDAGIRDVVKKRDWGYLRLVNKLYLGAGHFLGKGPSWLVYFVTGGGRFWVPSLAKRLVMGHQIAVKQ